MSESGEKNEAVTASPIKQKPERPPYYYLNVVNLGVCLFIGTVNDISFAAVLPAVAESLSATTAQTYWCGTVLLFTQCIAQIIYGALAEPLGRRACVLIALAIFAFASLLAALAQSIEWLIAVRAIEGLGIGGVNVAVNVIIADMAPMRERAQLNGIVSLFGALGLVVGVMVGGAAAEHSWRIIFWINLPIAVVAFVLFVLFLRVSRGNELGIRGLLRVDWVGIILLSSSVTGILFGLISGGTIYSWSSAAVIVPLVLGGCGTVVFAAYEYCVAGKYGLASPFIPSRLFSNRTATFGYVISLFHALILWALPYYFILYLHVCQSKSLLESSVLVLPSTIIIPLGALAGGIMMSRLAHFKYINLFSILLMSGGLTGLATLRPDSSTGQLVGYQCLFGTGSGILFPGRVVAVQAAQSRQWRQEGNGAEVQDADVRIATSLVSFFCSLGQAFGIAIGSATLQNTWDPLVYDALNAGQLTGGINNSTSFIIPGSQAVTAAEIVSSFPIGIAAIYRDIAAQSISRVWLVCLGFTAASALAAVASRNLSLVEPESHSHDESGCSNPEIIETKENMATITETRMGNVPGKVAVSKDEMDMF